MSKLSGKSYIHKWLHKKHNRFNSENELNQVGFKCTQNEFNLVNLLFNLIGCLHHFTYEVKQAKNQLFLLALCLLLIVVIIIL